MRNLTDDPIVISYLSDHSLTEKEFSVLNEGPKYGIISTHFDFLSTPSTF